MQFRKHYRSRGLFNAGTSSIMLRLELFLSKLLVTQLKEQAYLNRFHELTSK
jgi:hypothetical protein